MASLVSIRPQGVRLSWCLAALVVLSFVLSGCASSRDAVMARIFEAPNVIHVCVRPPNVPKAALSWGVTVDGTPLTNAREVESARRDGLAVYVFDAESPPESAKLLPIPYNRLSCPARVLPPRILPQKPRAEAAKLGEVEANKKQEPQKAERPKPLPQRAHVATVKRVASRRCPDPGQTRARGSAGSPGCTRVVVTARKPEPVVAAARSVEPQQRCVEAGQARRRSGSDARTCSRVLVKRPAAELVVAESQPRPVPAPAAPVPKDPSEVEPGELWRYDDWRQTPEETARLERAYECLQGVCHSRHQNFQKDKGKPAGTHDGQSLSTGSGSGGTSAPQPAPKTTVKTRTKPVPRKSNGGAAGQGGQAGSGSAADPPPQAKPKRGGENPAAARGREVHEEFKKKVKAKEKEGWDPNPRIDVRGGGQVRPDALTPKGNPIELKPNTPSGKAAGKRQMKKYEAATNKRGRVIYYEP